ncbi:helix-turn-helix domain-containing protein [Staphylococcus hominis]|uniref:helix-turn-helix domain-containing protein n=1 Tax=Staphylococcus hominis TaxID=1290 RepID=UPI0021182E36|nr:helix-turn-helix transcriptional regulator [Staphylococcus hominis]
MNLDRLAKTRKRRKKTQDEMTTALGFQSRSAYLKRENGVVSLGADELAIIAELLGYDITYFFD